MKKRIKADSHYIEADVSIKRKAKFNVIIAHGANNDMDLPLIKKLFDSLKGNYSVMRFNFSFAHGNSEQNEPRNSDELACCIEYMGNKGIVLIGKSYGGYLSTILAKNPKYNIKKVVVLGYSLHEPDMPNKMYYPSYIKNAGLPIVFIVGDSDPLCNAETLKEVLPEYEIHVIKNADHSFRPVKKGGKNTNDKQVVRIIKDTISNLTKQ